MIVVSNASPLIILAKIGRLEVLRLLHGRVIVPAEVYAEVVIPGVALPGAMQIAQAGWIETRRLGNIEALSDALAVALAQGELAAILLAEEIKADLILLDDRPARRLAVAKGLRVRGCVGILEAAYRKGYLADLRQAYADLLAHRAYVARLILDASLARLGLRPL